LDFGAIELAEDDRHGIEARDFDIDILNFLATMSISRIRTRMVMRSSSLDSVPPASTVTEEFPFEDFVLKSCLSELPRISKTLIFLRTMICSVRLN
jgi:hypothetical protein